MRRVIAFTIVVAAVCMGCAFAAEGSKGAVKPPALHMPYGGKVVMDVNIADENVLGLIKQILPILTDAAKSAAAEDPANPFLWNMPDLLKADMQPLFESIAGVKKFRVVAVKYGKAAVGANLLRQSDVGVAKIGAFTKIASQAPDKSGGLEIYSQTDGGGYIGFVYDSGEKMLLGVRVVGVVDVIKLITCARSAGIGISGLGEGPAEPASDVAPDESRN